MCSISHLCLCTLMQMWVIFCKISSFGHTTQSQQRCMSKLTQHNISAEHTVPGNGLPLPAPVASSSAPQPTILTQILTHVSSSATCERGQDIRTISSLLPCPQFALEGVTVWGDDGHLHLRPTDLPTHRYTFRQSWHTQGLTMSSIKWLAKTGAQQKNLRQQEDDAAEHPRSI